MRVVVGTGNAGKLREFQNMLAPLGLQVVGAPAAYARMDVQETGDTFEANARIKLAALVACMAQDTNLQADDIALCDDSGLQVEALAQAPGVLSARYAQAAAHESQDAANRRKLLHALRNAPDGARAAQFVAVLAVRLPQAGVQIFRGTCRGSIALAEAGDAGFGYDPLFIPQGHSQTFAQLPAAVKHASSHRGAAIAQLLAALRFTT